MLVLSRKRTERIRIGNDIFAEVIRTGQNTVKLGIEAPDNIRVLREELTGSTAREVPELSLVLAGLPR
ncbi:MAG: carbon storage regulator [Planctomycetota bacterium]|nr:carbon storage regulator [Planctomycetota bacterium]